MYFDDYIILKFNISAFLYITPIYHYYNIKQRTSKGHKPSFEGYLPTLPESSLQHPKKLSSFIFCCLIRNKKCRKRSIYYSIMLSYATLQKRYNYRIYTIFAEFAHHNPWMPRKKGCAEDVHCILSAQRALSSSGEDSHRNRP